ncbi:MAG TPA: crossover junction endodeoxyribonuclease RuvC [Thermoanaerobaculia bacterium]|nr:crossover junction endodeoxyribonuclease RuvC [Thermoanaerobaculia bacterium]
MRILGLDPGSLHTGYGVLEARGSELRALAVGRISARRGDSLPSRLAQLALEAKELLVRWQPEVVVVEAPFRGINSRSLIVLAEARGALLAAAALSGAEVREFSPAEVKSAVTGYGRAEKEQVARMVRVLLALDEEPLPFDATDALAVAICCAHRSRMDSLVARRETPAATRK